MPIGSSAYDLLEVIINEFYFQGINTLNSLQRKFYIDTHFTDGSSIDITDYNRVFILQNKIINNSLNNYSNSNYFQEMTNKILKNIACFVDWRNESILENINRIDINDYYINNNYNINKQENIILFKDILNKLILSIIYNLKDDIEIDCETLKKVVFYYNFDNYQDDTRTKSSLRRDSNGDLNISTKNLESNNNDLETEKSIRHSLEFLIKIINIGLDKEKSEFDCDIKEIISSILDDIRNKNSLLFKNSSESKNELNENNNSNSNLNVNFGSNLLNMDLFSSLNFFNKSLAKYTYNLVDEEIDDYFEVYLNFIKNIMVKNLIPNNILENDNDTLYCKTINTNLIKEMKMNILLVEQETNQSTNYNENESMLNNISTISIFINKLFEINKRLEKYYKKKEEKENVYKTIIDDFYKVFNFEKTDSNSNIFENSNNIVDTQINKESLEPNNDFKLNFNYILYLLPGNCLELFNSNSNAFVNDFDKTAYINTSSYKFNNTSILNTNPSILNYSLANNSKENRQQNQANANQINLNFFNTSYLCRYIAKKDFTYRTLIANLWNNINYDASEDEIINSGRIQVLKENLDLYINEAENIFDLYLFKIELVKVPSLLLNSNRTLSNQGNELNESEEFLFWKNLKIIRKEDENNKKKGQEASNSIKIE